MGVVGADPGKGVRRTGDVALREAGVTSECRTVVNISFDCSVGRGTLDTRSLYFYR